MRVYLGISISSLSSKELHLNNQGATVVRVIACKIAANEIMNFLYQKNKVLTTLEPLKRLDWVARKGTKGTAQNDPIALWMMDGWMDGWMDG
ncbi:hypothetical protein EYC84_001689 [Monilinia fructicola]|uniref:Uncharacterized protein n=1 Tax=Monilinia fructicola TaxID=38448 RepID=A0A5M9JUD2_MONFR|nr:hypothetical protein EYC84_001689 [Monilinia fructicola]